ncbi:hypothetical protein FG386_003068 [Cryptosporidium ryanae]|uniref:uncharacterized protein n=1 Tax=Cryptosporidium ryanae TaxID=515981 RepID=UPI003519E96C|nr:hypothetical protein FG386_003068 [Cryptosporidium ryanae]
MEEGKFSFSIKNQKEQKNFKHSYLQFAFHNVKDESSSEHIDNTKYCLNGINNKNLVIFNEHDGKNENNNSKVTRITSFSNAEESIKVEKKENTGESDEYIIECKNSLNNNQNVKSNIEFLFKNRKKLDLSETLDTNNNGVNKNNIPIEKFGLAMLRGMGYNPEIHNTKPKIYKKRNYNQSGLGADMVMKNLFKKK